MRKCFTDTSTLHIAYHSKDIALYDICEPLRSPPNRRKRGSLPLSEVAWAIPGLLNRFSMSKMIASGRPEYDHATRILSSLSNG
jgi:hypothetical protein